MWPGGESNPRPLTYESGALPTALCDPAFRKRVGGGGGGGGWRWAYAIGADPVSTPQTRNQFRVYIVFAYRIFTQDTIKVKY